MNAYKVDAVVTENGLTILAGLSLPIGSSVEVIILDKEQPLANDVSVKN